MDEVGTTWKFVGLIDGVRKQWWLESRTMRGKKMANSLVDWLNEEIKDPTTHEWGWDRVAFFGPKKRSREEDQERVDAAEPGLKDLIASRARKEYDFAGANVVPIDFNHGTKRKYRYLLLRYSRHPEQCPSMRKMPIYITTCRNSRKLTRVSNMQPLQPGR